MEEIAEGKLYFLKTEFIEKYKSKYNLLDNEKISTNKRPTYYCIKDNKNEEILWFVPLSRQYNKYYNIYLSKLHKNKSNKNILNFVFIENVAGEKSVLLIQNMFPVTKDYIEKEYKRNSQPVKIPNIKKKEILDKVTQVLINAKQNRDYVSFTRPLEFKDELLRNVNKNSNQFLRTEMLIGKEAVQKLHNFKVAIFGLGGVGSFVTEGLARAGIENFVLVDNDVVDITNLNRQLIAIHKTIGKSKVDIMKDRILEINPKAEVEIYQDFFMPDSSHDMIDDSVDYIVDAVDTVTAKIELVITANKMNIPIISAMGTGNKLDPTRFEVTDIYKTEMCPLAKVMRKELKARDINKLKVVYSKEKPIKSIEQVPASISFVPSVAGLIISGEVVKDLIN